MHLRQAIRQAVAKQLAGLPCPVRTSQVLPVDQDAFPVVLIYTVAEQADRISMSGTRERKLDLVIDVRASADEGVDDVLDAIAAAVETAMDSDQTLGGVAQDSDLVALEIGLMGGDGQTPCGACRMTYRVTMIVPLGGHLVPG